MWDARPLKKQQLLAKNKLIIYNINEGAAEKNCLTIIHLDHHGLMNRLKK